MLNISPFTTLVNLEHFICGTPHCVIVFGWWIFDKNIQFSILLTNEKCTNFALMMMNKKEEIVKTFIERYWVLSNREKYIFCSQKYIDEMFDV